uniref:protein FAM3B-like isoform X1 n=2 Tax=Myxine glutinosa TaxID=7769 RepID=UPI00358DF2FC
MPALPEIKCLQMTMLFLVTCVCCWILGVLIGHGAAKHAINIGIDQVEGILKLTAKKAPSPRQNPCGLAQQCPPQHHPFRLTSGGGLNVLPRLCFDNNSIFAMNSDKLGRGMNIAVLKVSTGDIDVKSYDMYEGDFSDPMVNFLKSLPNGSIIFIATHDDGATRLSPKARTVLGEMGSNEIANLKFRDNWVFVTGRGFNLAGHYEQIVHRGESQQSFGDWPNHAVSEGCLLYNSSKLHQTEH